MKAKADKSQLIRVFDFTLIGPYMLWYSYKSDMPKEHKAILSFLGIATIVYNFNNWNINRK